MLSHITAAVKAARFTYVTLDTEGYRSGSMNALLPVSSLLAGAASTELSEAAAELLYQILLRRQSEYPTTNGEADSSALGSGNNVQSMSTSEQRRHMARQVIEGEKQVLHEATAHLRSLANGATGKRGANTLEEEASHQAKKQRAG